jgi:hypothetical protein
MYARVVRFEGADGTEAAKEIAAQNESEGGPPPDLPAKKLLILGDAEGRRSLAITFFESEDDYRRGDEKLNSMSPPGEGMGERTAVEKYEVMLDLDA